ncbi:DNA repair protein rad51c, partial [Rhizopus stolonifer]
QKLENAGYETAEELKKANLIQLSKDLQLTKEEVEFIMTVTNKDVKLQKQSMAERIAQAEEQGITLSSKNLDRLMYRGIPVYKITEICGESGSGKTQICMQLAVNVQLSTAEGGLEGECIYVDTEGSFMPSRLLDIANELDIEAISKGIHVFRIHSHYEMTAFVRQLTTILKEYPKVKLIVIDSMAYHFRLNTLDMKKRTYFVNHLAQTLLQIANTNKLAVVATNHVTLSGADGKWVPSLSSSWGNWCTNRLFLYRKRHFRFGLLFKSIENSQSRPAQFRIKDTGISDPDEDEAHLLEMSTERETEVKNELGSTIEEMQFSAAIKECERNMLDNDWDEHDIQEGHAGIKIEPTTEEDSMVLNGLATHLSMTKDGLVAEGSNTVVDPMSQEESVNVNKSVMKEGNINIVRPITQEEPEPMSLDEEPMSQEKEHISTTELISQLGEPAATTEIILQEESNSAVKPVARGEGLITTELMLQRMENSDAIDKLQKGEKRVAMDEPLPQRKDNTVTHEPVAQEEEHITTAEVTPMSKGEESITIAKFGGQRETADATKESKSEFNEHGKNLRTEDDTKINQHGTKRRRENDDSESEYWSSGMEDDLEFLINIENEL